MKWAKLALPVFVTSIIVAGITALAYAPAPTIKADSEPRRVSKPPLPAAAAKHGETATARDVGGGAVAAPDVSSQTLERIAPAPPDQEPLEFFGPPIPPLVREDVFLLFRPLPINAGTIIAEGRTITLAGVVPVEAGRMCTTTDGKQWPCGIKGRTALRALIRGRAISCLLPDQQKAMVETECSIGKIDLAEWLVEQGWAGAQPGSDLENLGKAAQLMGRGIYGTGS